MAAARSKKPKTFAPSLAGRCLRYVVMDLLGFGRIMTDDTLAAMRAGASWHKTFQAGIARQSEVVGLELPVKNEELGISGRIDAVVRENGQTVAVEYKTVHDDKFREIAAHGPVFDHWAQLALYVNLGNYDMGRLIVDNRESEERLGWDLLPDPQWKAWIVERIQLAQNHQLQRTLPSREISVRCLYCDRWQRCFKTAEERDERVQSHPQWEPNPPLPEQFFTTGSYGSLSERAEHSN